MYFSGLWQCLFPRLPFASSVVWSHLPAMLWQFSSKFNIAKVSSRAGFIFLYKHPSQKSIAKCSRDTNKCEETSILFTLTLVLGDM